MAEVNFVVVINVKNTRRIHMFEEKERLLANEAELTSSMLANGLTSLRKANVYNKGLYYQAFFFAFDWNRKASEDYTYYTIQV